MASASDTLRHTIETCGKTRYQIAQETGIAASVLSRFVASGRGLSCDNFDKLCAYLDLELVAKKKRNTKG